MVNIRHSKYMDTSPLGSIEKYMCRIPKSTREKLGIEIGDSIKVSNKISDVILKVGYAYEYDMRLFNDYDGIFLQREIYDKLNMLETGYIEKIPSMTIGADPEVFLVSASEGNLIDASMLYNSYYAGNDCGLIELRPGPGETPKKLLSHIYALILASEVINRGDNYRILPSSFYNENSAGFHIHFGRKLVTEADLYPFMKTMGYLLDFFVAIPAIYFERYEDDLRRLQGEYGKPGDVKPSLHSFEYRTIGGHIIADPRITYFILLLAYVMVSDLYTLYQEQRKVIESYYNLQLAYPTLPSREVVTNILTTNNGKIAADKFIHDIVSAADSYSYHDIDRAFNAAKSVKYVREDNLLVTWLSHMHKINY